MHVAESWGGTIGQYPPIWEASKIHTAWLSCNPIGYISSSSVRSTVLRIFCKSNITRISDDDPYLCLLDCKNGIPVRNIWQSWFSIYSIKHWKGIHCYCYQRAAHDQLRHSLSQINVWIIGLGSSRYPWSSILSSSQELAHVLYSRSSAESRILSLPLRSVTTDDGIPIQKWLHAPHFYQNIYSTSQKKNNKNATWSIIVCLFNSWTLHWTRVIVWLILLCTYSCPTTWN